MLAAIVLSTGGCRAVARLRGIQPPEAEVTGVHVLEQTEEGARVRVQVKLTNPNDVPLPVVASDYHMTLAEAGSFKFVDRPGRTLPAESSGSVELMAAFETGGADVSGRSYRVTGWLFYEPPGQLRRLLTESSIPLPRVRVDTAGHLQ